ncbi:DNA ligase [Eremomyces bilateralis CBS 781.70]|uniref:DNA ligase n=1 Tax=Eremomyces bilateralis CBS 781.70 TaxID=1392243 RepID=A0A6G1GAQ6_9PEZI|nr:DNA ligase [Eremomyces bilateralis CBS 781.70]KAF1815104.1 DNA ligase [Eremomyces bilateralis CBS 781.70]
MANTHMRDAAAVDEERRMYSYGSLTETELDEKYPNRPHNHSVTPSFSILYTTLFNPLNDNRRKPTAPVARRKLGPHGASNLTPHEIRRNIIESFISRWRKEVGNDIYPAFRLVVPEKDRDRAMYGLKEKAIGKLLVKILRIDKDSQDGFNLLNWKLPGGQTHAAGDFAGRCYEVISKRPMRTEPGDMTIGEVNEKLDILSGMSKEVDQIKVFSEFYQRMNPDELIWLIRIILRQMKIGASERTFFDIWHPDADSLFNVSSSLRRVCWELYDPVIRLDEDTSGVTLMQCFQPQLAAFQMHSFEKMVQRMKPTEADDVFWIEEKLDGERMQLHMVEDESVLGGFRFNFWSRKAKDYTYLYGSGFEDDNSSLTRHIRDAFNPGVRNVILDGEMITWDVEQDAMVPFGTLKTAAISEQRNPFSGGQRPLYRVFDCLYLNDKALTLYTLRDRRKALESSISSIHRRIEIHSYIEGNSASSIEPALRRVVAEASEGLVIKNPRSPYRLNERNDDWIKVKPEYMSEFGEELDCVVIGGYYGSGHRGGNLASFLCGLRVDQNHVARGSNEQKCYSFFKVGGGFCAADYAEIRHRTDNKWIKWDPKKPPSDWIELGGGDKQYERPDVWIKPEDSIVVSVKAASVGTTDQFKMGLTLRFPRFKRLRPDKYWKDALSVMGFMQLKSNAEKQHKENEFQLDNERRKKRMTIKRPKKRPLQVLGANDEVSTPYAALSTKVFEGLSFFIMSESLAPEKKSKAELEDMVKVHGGSIVQTQTASRDVICISDREVLKARSIKKSADRSIIRPIWLFDCIKQAQADVGRPRYLIPYEEQHMYFSTHDDQAVVDSTTDEFGDSYARDVDLGELRGILAKFPKSEDKHQHAKAMEIVDHLEDHGLDLSDRFIFQGSVLYLDFGDGAAKTPEFTAAIDELQAVGRKARFVGGTLSNSLDESVTQVVVGRDRSHLHQLRQKVSQMSPIPKIVDAAWIIESYQERTLLDEDRFIAR